MPDLALISVVKTTVADRYASRVPELVDRALGEGMQGRIAGMRVEVTHSSAEDFGESRERLRNAQDNIDALTLQLATANETITNLTSAGAAAQSEIAGLRASIDVLQSELVATTEGRDRALQALADAGARKPDEGPSHAES